LSVAHLILGVPAALAFLMIVLSARTELAVSICATSALALVIGVPVLRLPSTESGLRIPLLGALVCLAILAVFRVGGIAVNSRIAPTLKVLLVLVALDCVATMQTPDHQQWRMFAAIWGTALAAALLATAVHKARAWDAVRKALVVFAVIQVGITVLEAGGIIGAPLWRGAVLRVDTITSSPLHNELVPGVMRSQGTFAHPLPLAIFLLLATCLVLARRERTRGAWILTALFALGIVLSGSRSALLILLSIVFVAVARDRRARGPAVTLYVMAAAAAAISFGSTVADLASELMSSGSYTHRLGSLDAVTNLLYHRGALATIIGDGTNAVPRLYSDGLLPSDGLQAIDNQLVFMLAQDGVVGVVLFSWLLVTLWRSPARWALPVAVVLTGATMMFEYTEWPSTGFLFCLLVTLASLTGAERRRVSASDPEMTRDLAAAATSRA
jgi:hypothetical protein